MQPEDVSVLSEWWSDYGMPLDERILPKKGFCYWEHDELYAGCFLCEMKLNGGWGGLISWTIVSPDHQLGGVRAVNRLLKEVKEYAKANGFIALMGSTTSRLLEKTYVDSGFCLGDALTNQYLITL